MPSGKGNEERGTTWFLPELFASPALVLALALAVALSALVLPDMRLAWVRGFFGLPLLPLAVPVLSRRL